MSLSQLSTPELFTAALTEVAADDPDRGVPHLVALHERPTREVFDAGAQLLADRSPTRRELGARVLRELGTADATGRRPFTVEAVPLLVDRLDREREPRVLGWLISALNYNCAHEALDDVLRFAGHPDPLVRFYVASALPALVDPARIEPDALDALQRLCRDDDADIRYYALYALVEEVAGAPAERVAQSVNDLLNDPDEQIRILALAHHDPETSGRG